MSSIKVALELDDSKYTQRLRDATSAADKFAKAATTGAKQTEASFSKVVGAADGLHLALGKVGSGAEAAARSASTLVSALTGLAAVAFIQSLLNGASASKDMSEAFGLSVESVLELQAAFGAAGRGPEKLNQALATLSDTSVSALQGNFGLRDSFAKLGISMSDLQTKSAKQIIQDVADVMTSGRATAAQLSASYDILGKSAKGLPWGDLKDKLDAVNGTMGPAAEAAIALDQTMKKLEATGSAVKKEFTLLLQPIADFFNSVSTNGNGAKLMAEGIAGAMLLIGGSAVLNGLRAVAGSVGSLIALFTGLTAATTASGAATTVSIGLSSADATARTIQAVGLGRVGTALVAVNVAQASLTTLQASGIASATTLAAAEDRLAAATARLAVVSEAATAAQATLAAAQGAGVITAGALGTAAATATTSVSALGTALYAIGVRVGAMVAALAAGLTSWAGFTAMVGAAGAALAAFLGPIGLAVAAIAAIGTAIVVAFDLHPIDAMASKLESLVKDTFPSLHGMITKIGDALGMAPSKLAQAAETSAERLKRLGITPNEGGRSNMGIVATPGPGVDVVTQGSRGELKVAGGLDKPIAEGVSTANPMAAQEQSLRDQMKLLELQNNLQREKLQLQLELVGASDAEKASRMASLEFESKKKQDLLRIDTEIAKMQATMNSGVKGEDAGKYGTQLDLLKQQRKQIAENKDDTSAITTEIVKQEQSYKNIIFYREMEIKAANGVKDITQAIADLNASEDTRRIAALEKQIALEVQAAQKRAQEQKGTGAAPMGAEESLAIAEKVRATYAGQIEAQKELNTATKERNQFLFVQDLTNRAIEDSIRLQADMLKLTQSADQQRITDLNTQLELLIRQQIVKEQSTLGKGETLSEERQLAIRKEVLEANKGLLASNQALIDKTREWSTGWEGAFAQYKSDAENAATQSRNYFDTFTSGFEDAIVKFVQTGKLSFKDLANNLIADFARVQAKKLLLGIMDLGGSGGGGLLSTIFGMGGRANGGPVSEGGAYMVGERGPEMFIPQTAGNIIPNSQGAGSITQVTYNIQAADAASFRQMIARDPEFLYAVTEKGRSSVPGGRR